MSVLVLDVETTTKNKGNPFTKSNKLCQVGILADSCYKIYDIEYSDNPYGSKLHDIQTEIDSSALLVGFSVKFDLHWLRRYGLHFQHKLIWDCQIAHFLITNQLSKYPSLDDVAEYYQLGQKEGLVAAMWEEGIDTPQIPWDILESYLKQDLALTYKVYLKQKEYFEAHPELFRLFFLEMVDLLVLEDMEFNGMRYNKDASIKLSEETTNTLRNIRSRFTGPDIVSYSSGDHISAILYGGSINEDYRESYVFNYKDGRQADKQRWAVRQHTFPRQVDPLPKTALKKEGFYATDKVTLQQLIKKRIPKETKALIQDIIEYGDLEHLNGTYYEGLVKQMDKHEDNEYIHGQFNQVVAVTGRLSSSAPNLQNRDKRIDHCFISRYD